MPHQYFAGSCIDSPTSDLAAKCRTPSKPSVSSDAGGVGEVGLDEPAAGRHRVGVPGGQVVHHHDLVPGLDEPRRAHASDISGPARDEQLHRDPRFLRFAVDSSGPARTRWSDVAASARCGHRREQARRRQRPLGERREHLVPDGASFAPGTSAIAEPPKPPPVILAPSAPAARAASTARSSSRQDTR